MLSRKEEFNLQFRQYIDGFLLAFALWAGHSLRLLSVRWFGYDPVPPFTEFYWLLVIIIPFGPIILELQGFYSNPFEKSLARSAEQFVRTAFWLGLIIALSSFFLRWDIPSRSVMPLFGLLAALLLLARDRYTHYQLRQRMRREDLREVVILVGALEDLRRFRHTFTPDEVMAMEIVAEIDLQTRPLSDLVHALHEHSVSRAIFVGGHSHLSMVEEAILACEVEGVEAWLVADFIRTTIARPTFDRFGNRPMLVFRTTPELSWALLLKHTMDRGGALLGLLIFALPMGAIALVIKLTSAGPIIFRQQRGGKHGRTFTMYKFRSMTTDAAMRHAELAAFNEMEGPVFKIERDPRVTSVGRWLRRTSLDELPQFWNVLQGDMSLVGPRPLPLYEVEKFESPAQRRRLSMKPGLTCLWQISGRNRIISFSEWVKLDLEYIDNWSIWLDVKILCRTVPAVLFGRGAK